MPVIILLRAVNLGARNRVPMADLKRMAADLGAQGARTLLNTGNLIVDAAPLGFEDSLLKRIASDLGVVTSCVRITDDDARAALALCPFGTDPAEARFSAVYAAFLSAQPSAEAAASLETGDFGDDHAAVRVLPSGAAVAFLGYAAAVHSSTLSNARVEKILGVTATSRSLSTVARFAQTQP
jgi:uncharacterized protein (DUF1697 family)